MRAGWHIAAGVAFLTYVAGVLIPAEVIFEPSPPVFADAIEGEPVELVQYHRRITQNASIAFYAVIREVGAAPPVCTGADGPFPYQAVDGPLLGKDLAWWTAHDHDCETLPPGTYWSQTTWTIHQPLAALLPDWLRMDALLGGLLPPKTITLDGPPFTIHPRS